jgi:hypothetical protein
MYRPKISPCSGQRGTLENMELDMQDHDTQQEATPRRHLQTLDEALQRAKPMGRNLAREVLLSDPRFPKPVLATEGRKLFSVMHLDLYFLAVERDGFPHMQGGAA